MEGALKKNDSNEEDQKMSAPQEQQEDPSFSIAAPAKKKRKKDKNKPKRPLSAYNLFFKDERLRYLKEEEEHPPTSGPKDKFLNMSREIGRRWMNLSSERRKVYEALAEEAMFRYRVSMDAYKARKRLEEDAAHQLLAQRIPTVAAARTALQLPDRALASASAFQSLEHNKPALESFLLANHASTLPTGALPMHMIQSAASRELVHRSQQDFAETNLLNYLLLEKLAQSRERAEDATTMRLNALMQARAPNEEHRMLRPDSRRLYDNRMLPTAPSMVMNQNQAPNHDLREQRKQELLEFVRQQQNPQWMELLNPANPTNPHANSQRKL
ncbi:hypothetical protein FisN_13Lh364 [Fistulifera solaris]|uniref:HMG box domain-containing protein n=1 Tax=Fistulifera solaris TaxID=1519565 RepID=A0A1Z5KM01_FISSO|nr:hypothetical protein FisN_13Lh364 [Fistulifera solaris]|eukprot:GAX27092.1 hypothetical protein FisN_13Lh364 [Fistulifera solaris]